MKKIIKSNLSKLQFLKKYIQDYSCWGVEEVYENISQDELDFLETILEKNGIASKDGVYISDMYNLIECYFIEKEGFEKC